MDKLNINKLLNREKYVENIINFINDFELNKNDVLVKRGLYIYGEHGTGKSVFIKNILTKLGYDIVKYDAGDIRNTEIIREVSKYNMSNKNIISLFNKQVKKIAIVMDEIDGMNNGDKGGINYLIKIIRPKKTKKQKLEDTSQCPIICIGNYRIDKKIKELMKVCNVIELSRPTKEEITNIFDLLLPTLQISNLNSIEKIMQLKNLIIDYVQGDLRKLDYIYKLHLSEPNFLTSNHFENILQIKNYNDNTKKIVNNLFDKYYEINDHNKIINETDRTSIGLLWHENIIDILEPIKKEISIPFYIKQLENICFSDYIDRITFQKQIWQFNEMSSLIKTFKNNKLFHDLFNSTKNSTNNEIRFTKVLTKYSTEYNNFIFIQKLCYKLKMDKKDLFAYFIYLKNTLNENELLHELEIYEISKLDMNRIYKYIDKYIKENASGIIEKNIEDDFEDEFENELDEMNSDEINL